MGSRLLYGSPQLSVRVTTFPLILIVFNITFGTIAGTPVKLYNLVASYIVTYLVQPWFVCIYIVAKQR